ncbi:MAG: outer membrane protein assembly factor BamD, partial [Bacteroidota bacterium]
MRVITIFFFLAFITKVQSQSPSLEFKAAYKQAKIDLKNKKYQEAKNKLEKLYQTNSSNSYSPYIQYFIAFANYQLENYQSAENELIKLQNSFANIEKKQDINYLLGLVYLRKKETENALTTFSKINNASFEKELNQEIQNYFAGNTNKKYIAELKIKYPNLKVLKELDSKPNIQNVYNLTENQIPYLHEKAPVNYQKGYYNIGLLLPFNLDSTQDSQTIGNQYVIDLYEGMLLATEKLKSEKINLKLHAYNIGNSQANMVSLLNNESFLSEDLLIGPLHNEANKIAQYYANNQKVAIINPLSTNKQLIDNKPFSFISKASSDGFVKQSVKFASSNFIGEFAVVYEESDDTIAKLY